jgi:hypothetical protein
MTNPNNSLGTNGAFGGRTSVNAFNDVLQTFESAGILSGFVVEPDSGMTVAVGGDGTTRDVAVAEDPFGNRTTVDNISGDPISVTINTASTTSARIDSIVAYVNSPATASDTSVDNPTACGIISVNGTSGGAPIDSAIRTAITADGGTGSTAYYVVIANVSVPANTTTITSGLISAGKSINLSDVATSGSNGLMSGADKSKLDGIDKTKLDDLMEYSSAEQVIGTWTNGKPLYRRTFSGTMSSSQTTTAIANIPSVVIRQAYGKLGWGGVANNFHEIGAYANANFYSLVQHNATTGELTIWATASYQSQSYELTIEYTKNTD